MKLLLFSILLGLVTLPGIAATITFGTGGNQFSIDFVGVGNAGNADDDTGYGGVSYGYQIGVHEVSRDMITKANALSSSLHLPLENMANFGGNTADRPATGMSWNDAARFVNWLNTSNGFQAAYQFLDPHRNGGYDPNLSLWSSEEAWQLGGENRFRHKDAHYFLPSEDEWYKAAHYNPGTSGYFDYATESDTVPTAVTSGTTEGTAVHSQNRLTGPADIINAGGLSSYGTMAQNGNVWEWAESGFHGRNNLSSESRVVRGGSWEDTSTYLSSSFRGELETGDFDISLGFRVASVPEPSTLWMILVGAVGLITSRYRKLRLI
ncbi:MAG: SUMF1/EgtB/PvdO family nonheme iron enzyme [Verrucomicrobiales bacterium]